MGTRMERAAWRRQLCHQIIVQLLCVCDLALSRGVRSLPNHLEITTLPLLPLLPLPASPRSVKTEAVDVPVGPMKQDFIHTVSISGSTADPSAPTLVLTPGYVSAIVSVYV
jgi:hypothetical protein